MPKTLIDRLNEGRQYRNTQRMEYRQQENGDGYVTGYATTFDEEYELYSYDNWEGYRVHIFESVDPHAFDQCSMDDCIMQYNHEGRVFARVSNDTLDIMPDSHGLRINAYLAGTETGRQLLEEIRGGYTTKMSFGFSVKKREATKEVDDENKIINVRVKITGISRLWDVSAVSLPANDGTEISARSYVDGVMDELAQEWRRADEIKKQKQRIKILTEVLL